MRDRCGGCCCWLDRFVAGLLFGAAYSMEASVCRRMDPMAWADLIDAEHDLYLAAVAPCDDGVYWSDRVPPLV